MSYMYKFAVKKTLRHTGSKQHKCKQKKVLLNTESYRNSKDTEINYRNMPKCTEILKAD